MRASCHCDTGTTSLGCELSGQVLAWLGPSWLVRGAGNPGDLCTSVFEALRHSRRDSRRRMPLDLSEADRDDEGSSQTLW
ncbi:unnamed protein product [Durusdinium trenchii]|uniref:Uncharacterized protein n=1 Tax=Durusdinium trenchii TaxID=1381693 RepID=A0ABP0HQM9_9DINO